MVAATMSSLRQCAEELQGPGTHNVRGRVIHFGEHDELALHTGLAQPTGEALRPRHAGLSEVGIPAAGEIRGVPVQVTHPDPERDLPYRIQVELATKALG